MIKKDYAHIIMALSRENFKAIAVIVFFRKRVNKTMFEIYTKREFINDSEFLGYGAFPYNILPVDILENIINIDRTSAEK